MQSTTNVTKGIEDFLWEWAESHCDWGKLLTEKIIQTESELSQGDRGQIFEYFIESLRKEKKLPILAVKKPNYAPTDKVIELIELSNVTGVNRLAKNQSLKFGKHLTIIYGENGTGKTGYGRILKSLGFSYDGSKSILSDIFKDRETQRAVIKYTVNEEEKTYPWAGIKPDNELQNISVFSNSCVAISLSDRHLLVSPPGFHLFNLMITELNILAGLLQERIKIYPTLVTWENLLNIGTPQQIFISSLNYKSTEQRLVELSSFTMDQEELLIKKKSELSNLNSVLLQNEILSYFLQLKEITELIDDITFAETLLTKANLALIVNSNQEIKALRSHAQKGLAEIVAHRGIAFYETAEFRKFIQSAEDYIRLLGKDAYPAEKDRCVYCNQPLDDFAVKLLLDYKNLLNDSTQQDIRFKENQRKELIEKLSAINDSLTIHQPTFGVDTEQNPLQPDFLTRYNLEIHTLKILILDQELTIVPANNPNFLEYKNTLIPKKEDLARLIENKKGMLKDISSKEDAVKKEIDELLDRKLLCEKQEEIKKLIVNHKIVQVLKSKSTEFTTNSISRKTTDAREALVKQSFSDLFQKELLALRKSHLPIEVNFGTDKGQSKVVQKIKSHLLVDILSEGEQKAIALAEFLTELQLDKIQAPVIFDDPVNSLDHRIIDEVAKRFIELSKNRQVVVFTHSILLLNSFIQQYELEFNKSFDRKFYSVFQNFGETGLVGDVEEINSYTYYIKKLQTVLDTKPDGLKEATLAAEGYGHLRSAIEICVEEEVLKKTIQRYRKGVAFPALLRIDGNKLDLQKGKLNDIYEKCCVSIDGHSSPGQIHNAPTIADLKVDYEQFKELRRLFINK